jgi:hypothetical protein
MEFTERAGSMIYPSVERTRLAHISSKNSIEQDAIYFEAGSINRSQVD